MKTLLDAGYKCWKEEIDYAGVKRQWQYRVDLREDFDESLPLCVCNDKLFFNINEYAYDVNGVYCHSFEIDITAENAAGDWCDLKIYSLTAEQIDNNLHYYEQKLLKMWRTFNETT